MKGDFRYLPVYQTLLLGDLGHNHSSKMNSAFPFSSNFGRWAFNGRSALNIGLAAMGLPEGSKILVPNYYQGVEIDTLLHNRYRLEFYRVSPSLEVDLNDVQEKLSATSSALYVIHYFGWPQDLPTITDFCKSRELKLIEDCALSLFSQDADDWLGTRGDMCIFSIYKTLPLPHGGYVVSKGRYPSSKLPAPPLASTLRQLANLLRQGFRHNNKVRMEELAKKISRTVGAFLPRRYSGKGIVSGTATWDPRLVKYGASRMISRLTRCFDPTAVVKIRRRNFAHLDRKLRDRFDSPLPDLPPHACPLFYPVMVENKIEVMRRLAERGVGSVNLWWLDHPACPEELAAEVSDFRRHLLELPIHQSLSEEDIDWVAETFLDINR